MINSAYANTVPYNDLTLEWKGSYEFNNLDAPSADKKEDLDFLFLYKSKDGDLIQQKNLKDDTEELINVLTREIVTGEDKGKHTSQWIPTNIKLGDKIEILGTEYTVTSLSDTIFLRDFGQIDAIKLTYKKITEDYVDSEGYFWKDNIYEEKIWYDQNSRLKLKEVDTTSYKHGFGSLSWRKIEKTEYELRENNVDTDKDGLTDLKELFQFLTNPTTSDTDSDGLPDKEEIDFGSNPLIQDTDEDGLTDKKEFDFKTVPTLKDSDGDLWNDKIDIGKTNSFFPNGILVLIVILISYFVYRKITKKKVRKK